VSRLGRVLREDAFYGVRIEAAKALATVHTPEAFAALRESAVQDDARVRSEVVRAIAKFYRDETFEFLREIVRDEKNPEIVSIALDGLGRFPNEEVRGLLVEALGRSSWRDEISAAAVKAMRAQDTPAYIEPLLDRLARDEEAFTHRGLGDALETLAFLARHEEDREPVRRLIAAKLDHPMEGIRVRAIGALGTLEDPRSLALLESYPVEPAERPENKAAAEAVKKLNASKPQATEVGDLRKDVLELEKDLRDLRKKLETLDKKVAPEKPSPGAK
jgi:aminopeptidase N